MIGHQIGDFNLVETIDSQKDIISERDKTLSSFILKVSRSDVGIVITMIYGDDKLRYKFTPSTLYEDGLTVVNRWRPYLLTYDTVNNIYIVVMDLESPLEFETLDVVLTPTSGTSVDYSYEMIFVS